MDFDWWKRDVNETGGSENKVKAGGRHNSSILSRLYSTKMAVTKKWPISRMGRTLQHPQHPLNPALIIKLLTQVAMGR